MDSDEHAHRSKDVHSCSSLSGVSEFARIDETKEIAPLELAAAEAEGEAAAHMSTSWREVSAWEYVAQLCSALSTWAFYCLYFAFWNWKDEATAFNGGDPTEAWRAYYAWLAAMYCAFLWSSLALNPFYFARFRGAAFDVDERGGTYCIKVCLLRMLILAAVAYCMLMTAYVCVVEYDRYLIRLAEITVRCHGPSSQKS